MLEMSALMLMLALSARRKFAPDNFFVMISQLDLKGFVAAAV